jgi:hypothetical protein
MPCRQAEPRHNLLAKPNLSYLPFHFCPILS